MTIYHYNNRIEIPILIIGFNRPKYIKNLIKKIKIARPKKLYIAMDGPRKNYKEDIYLCNKVREILNNEINWECVVRKKYENFNLGTKKAVYSAISWLFYNEEMGIILEDDIDPDYSFFKFAEELLFKYNKINIIKVISGNNYFNNHKTIKESYYFSQTPATHGWASWRRAWKAMDIKMLDWKNRKNFFSICNFFNYNFSRSHYFYKRFDLSYKNLIDSWDYQFFYSIIKNDGIIIKPRVNLCKHTGWGADATRGKGKDTFPEIIANEINFPLKHPLKIIINKKLDILEDNKVRRLSFLKYFLSLAKNKIFKN